MHPIQSFAPRTLAEIIRRQPASNARTGFAWQMAVGQALARVTTVELADGVLTVTCDPRWATELARARDEVLRRLLALLGPDAVRRIEIVGTHS